MLDANTRNQIFPIGISFGEKHVFGDIIRRNFGIK
jgi:hypothetical protein